MTMTFGEALTALESGRKVARAGWNGKGMWLIYVPEGNPVGLLPHIDMMTAQGDMQPGWLASQTDMLAKDWRIV